MNRNFLQLWLCVPLSTKMTLCDVMWFSQTEHWPFNTRMKNVASNFHTASANRCALLYLDIYIQNKVCSLSVCVCASGRSSLAKPKNMRYIIIFLLVHLSLWFFFCSNSFIVIFLIGKNDCIKTEYRSMKRKQDFWTESTSFAQNQSIFWFIF